MKVSCKFCKEGVNVSPHFHDTLLQTIMDYRLEKASYIARTGLSFICPVCGIINHDMKEKELKDSDLLKFIFE